MIKRMIITILLVMITAARLILGIALRLSDWIFYVLGGLFLLVTLCCYYMQLAAGEELKRMLISSGIMFLIPQAFTILETILEIAAARLSAARYEHL